MAPWHGARKAIVLHCVGVLVLYAHPAACRSTRTTSFTLYVIHIYDFLNYSTLYGTLVALCTIYTSDLSENTGEGTRVSGNTHCSRLTSPPLSPSPIQAEDSTGIPRSYGHISGVESPPKAIYCVA